MGVTADTVPVTAASKWCQFEGHIPRVRAIVGHCRKGGLLLGKFEAYRDRPASMPPLAGDATLPG